MIADRARGHGHGAHPEALGHLLLGGEAQGSQRGERPRAAPQHGHEHAALAAAQTLHVAAQLVDPHRHLEAEGRGHRVLAVRASREEDVLGPLGEVGERGQDGRELTQEDVMGAPHLEELAGLRDVLGRGPPVHVAAGVAFAGAIQLPDQRHERMPCAGQACPHRLEVEVRHVRLAGDLAGGALGNDAQLGLRLREGRFDVEPGLEARGLGEQRPHARVVDPERGRLFLHESDVARRSRIVNEAGPTPGGPGLDQRPGPGQIQRGLGGWAASPRIDGGCPRHPKSERPPQEGEDHMANVTVYTNIG